MLSGPGLHIYLCILTQSVYCDIQYTRKAIPPLNVVFLFFCFMSCLRHTNREEYSRGSAQYTIFDRNLSSSQCAALDYRE